MTWTEVAFRTFFTFGADEERNSLQTEFMLKENYTLIISIINQNKSTINDSLIS
jgi:hypothetical protein